jgi:putative transposase
VFVERLWRSIKYEEVYLHAYDSVSEARASVGRSTLPLRMAA